MSKSKKDYLPLTVLMYGAFVATVASLAWGALVYSQIATMSGEPAGAYMYCVVVLAESCNFYRGMGWLQGLNPYEPLVFWWAVSLGGVAVWWRSRERRAVA